MTTTMASTQAINALFTFLDQLDSTVFWIRSADFQRQLYLSAAYEKIWGRSSEDLYNNPLSFQETLILDDLQRNMNEFYRRMDSAGGSAMAFRIHRPDGETRWIKDTSYTVTNSDGTPIAIVGVGESISPEQWELWTKDTTHTPMPHAQLKDFLTVLQTEQGLLLPPPVSQQAEPETISKELKIDGDIIPLSRREAQCLQYLMKGMSAKETAYLLHLSPRTVETYLENLRKKAGCRSKLALIGKLQRESNDHAMK